MLPNAPIVITNSNRRQSVKPETEGLRITIVAALDPSESSAITSTVCLVLTPGCAVKFADSSSLSVDTVPSCSLLDFQVTFPAGSCWKAWKGIDCEPFADATSGK